MSEVKRPTAEQMAKFKKNANDQSLSAEVRAKFQAIVDKFENVTEEVGEDVVKDVEPKKRGRKPATEKKTPAPKKAVGSKKSVDDIEKAKAEIKRKTGKTEEECESIIEQYRALRTKAQEGKRKAEEASASNKKRVEKLDNKGDLIEGTNIKTADAVIESTAKDVAEKIEQQIEAVEEKAEKEAKAEVAKDNTIKTPKAKKEAVQEKVDEKVKKETKVVVERVVIDTSALLTSIATSLGKFDKDSQKEFLIKLRSDIDKLLSKYAFGGMTNGAVQVMNIQQSNMSSSSVNPTMFAKGGVVGQEIVFDYNGEETKGVIKDISNLGDYVVTTDNGRTLLAQPDLDVISLGAMRQQGMEQRKKRFGFFDEGGGVDDISYEAILDVLKDKLDDAVQEVPNHFENAYNAEGQEVEHESRDGFIPFTNGGYEVRWFDYLSYFWSSGYSLPTFALDKEKDRQIDYQMEMAKERFMNEYPEIVEELGEGNIDYNSLDEAGYSDEAEELSMYESEFEDDTIMCEIGAYYYAPNNDRGIDGKHTLRLFGLVNLESPYHRSGNLEDRYDIDITFDSIEELEEKVEQGLNEITNWFDGSDYNGSTEELRIVRMAKGGLTEHGLKVGDKIEKKLDSEGSVIRVKNKKENAFVELDSGFRMPIYEFSSMAKGGGVRSNSNQVREKVRQHILENVYDYDENEFDNFNDASQHLTSEFKRVADYPNNISRFPNNQKRFRDYLQGIPFNFYFYDDDIEDFLNGLGINPKNKKYSSDQMWDLYSYLILKEVEPTYNAKKMAKGGGIATNLSIAQTRRIANETAKALGSDFKVTRGSVDVASFDLDFQGQYTEGGSYVIHSNGDVVNYGLPNKPVYYNYKTKKKYAKGGDIASMMRNRRGK